jgi:chemotaxis receptor (MCP) glutamine deamidase CheD/CheY-like chemotaxis protein
MPEKIFLLPGEMAYQREQTDISTLLGSCVAVTLYDRKRSWGGLNHYMVPDQIGSLPEGKVAGSAINALMRMAKMAGSAATDLDARIIGGAAVIGTSATGSASVLGDIGGRNVEIARKILHELGIRVVQEEVGGTRGRRINMNSTSGQVTISTMGSSPSVEPKKPARKPGEPIRALIIDDSALVRQLIGKIINQSNDIVVCGEAEDPFQAREKILELDPDILCLDLIMPKLDGLSFLRRLMQYKPIPTVVISTIAKQGSAMRSKVMEAGAVDAIDKEDLRLHGGSTDQASRMLLPALRRAALAQVTARPAGVPS